MDKCISVLEELAKAEEGIQKGWQKRVPPERRQSAGHTIRRYLRKNLTVVKSKDGPYLNTLPVSMKIPLQASRDIYSFFFDKKNDDDFYFEE